MKRLARLIFAGLLSVIAGAAQADATITTVAGGGPNNMPALSANLDNPTGVAVGSAGNQYIVAQYQNRVFKVDTAGQLTVFAGNGNLGFSGDGGPATAASLDSPAGIALDGSGNLYIADYGNDRIRRVDAATGIITTVAGNGNLGFSGDGGPATQASLAYPTGVALDSGGNLYFTAPDDNRIRRVDAATGIISTVAGNGSYGFTGDGGLAIVASLCSPRGITVDSSGNLYVGDTYNQRIRRVDAATHIITTVAGDGANAFSGDGGPATAASLYNPVGIAADSGGNLYIADSYNQRVRRVDPSGIITTVAGNATYVFSGDGGPATEASLLYPAGVALDSGGNLYIADTYHQRVRLVGAASGVINTLAGNGTSWFSGDGGGATDASLYSYGVAADNGGNLYIADTYNRRIRRVDTGGIISTIAGNGTAAFSGDGGPATSASIDLGFGVALDSSINLYFADSRNLRVRRVAAATGVITTVAGNGSAGPGGDGGPATSASLQDGPNGVAVDSSGNLYIADTANERIRRVDAITGIITTVAGNGTYGFSGDGGPATSAALGYPTNVALDGGGNLYIADAYNHRIRRVAPDGIITTVAGDGTQGYNGDGGPATSASLAYPYGVGVDSNGDLYVADTANHRIRRVDAGGIITTVVGNGIYGFSGDGGLSIAASLAFPYGVASDASGNLHIADAANRRIRLVLRIPAAAIDYLANKIANSTLKPAVKKPAAKRLSIAKELVSKEPALALNAGTQLVSTLAVSDNNPNNDAAACGILTSIVNEITAIQIPAELSAIEADGLIQAANLAKLTIGCR